MTLPEEIYTALLSKWPVARLATVSADGRPHAVPVVFCECDGVIYSPVDGKRKRTVRLKRFSNLAANPQATLLLDHYTVDWQSLWWVRIDGAADRFEPAAAEAKAIANGLLEKYPHYQAPSLMFDRSVFLRLRPANIAAWSQSGSSAAIVLSVAELARA